MRYKAFISYKHGSASGFARRFELSLKNYARRLFSRPLRIFRDENHLVPGIDLPRMISQALEDSEFLILLASPGAAKSDWVRDEILEWCGKSERIERLIVILTEGRILTGKDKRINWDETDALPVEIAPLLTTIPYFIDFSWCVFEHDFDLSNARYKQEINRISARLRNIDPNEMLGIEVKEYRRSLWIRNFAIGALAVLSLVAFAFGLYASWQSSIAQQRQKQARASLAQSYFERGQRAWEDREALQAEISFASALTIEDSPDTREAYLEVRSRGVELLWTAPTKRAGSAQAISPDGRRFVVAGRDNILRTYSADSLLLMSAARSPAGTVSAMAFSPAGDRTVLGGLEGEMALWDPEGGGATLRVPGAHTGGILAVAFEDTGNLLSVGEDNRIKSWSISGDLLRELPVAQPQLKEVVILDGRIYAGDSRGMVRIFDSKKGEEVGKAEMSRSGIGAIAVEPGGRLVAAWGDGSQLGEISDQSLRIWDTEKPAEIDTMLEKPGIPQAGSLAFSPDGATLAIGGSEIRLWPLTSGAAPATLGEGNGGLVFEKSGRRLFSGGDSLKRWDVREKKLEGSFRGHHKAVAAVAFSPGGAFIATGSFDASLRLLNASDGSELWSAQSTDAVAHVEFSPDGERILGCSRGGFVMILEAETGAEIQRLSIGSAQAAQCAAFSADGNWLAVLENPRSVAFYPPYGETAMRRIALRENATGIVFRGNSEVLLVSRADGSILEIDSSDYERILSSGLASGGTNQEIRSSPNGKILAATTKEEIVLFDMDHPEHPYLVVQADSSSQGVAFSPDGQRMASAHYGFVQVWNSFNGKKLLRISAAGGQKTWMRRPAFSPNGRALLLGDQNANLRLFSFEDGALARTIRPPDRHVGDSVFAADPAFLSEEVLALADYDGSIRAWEIASGRLEWEVPICEGVPRHMIFDRHAGRLVAVCLDGRLFELHPGETEARLLTHLGYEGGALALSPDGTLLAAAMPEDSGSKVDIRRGEDGREITQLEGHHRYLEDLAFSPDGRHLASASYDRNSIVWNVDDWHEAFRQKGYGGTVTDTTFDPRGSRLATASRDGFLRILALPSGRLEQAILVSGGQHPWVESVSYGEGGAWIAAGGKGNTVLWDTATWQRIVELRGHENGWMHQIEFSPQSTWLLTESSDEAVRIWNIPTLKKLLKAPPQEILAASVRRTWLEPLSSESTAEKASTFSDFLDWCWSRVRQLRHR